ncbi:DUF3298 and DUF4163 domain-containing protein [Mucilaginibacter sp. FT3.2]|uniref:DUF3298 and DUF4163 domain-containing protein n=1 Tax=Mucilaginibacter sp. FT3.2 TaxID=2723090 RepID=UPI001612F86C|nr:DUF3298 and DUF4163 domain-containing protein [Mucilaginibacter sp. FT3.2]MBB6229893.1 hypothetical protein [Mucilaginibacter sp. FT3.2]
MKTIYAICFICVTSAFASCQWGVTPKQDKAVVKDTLNYSYKTVHERALDCGNKPVSACTVVNIKYPVFEGQKTLNDSVTRKLTSMFAVDGKPDSTVELMGKNFLKAYTDFRKTDPKSAMYFTLDSHAHVLMQDSGITTLDIGGYSFQGGAHGASATFFINWNTKANKSITLNDLFIDGYPGKLSAIAEGIFRKNEKLSDTASLARDYFFKDNKFALNDNFSVTPLGLKFVYNQYEIKPYAAGITELFIPYSQLKSLLLPNSVVGKFAK